MEYSVIKILIKKFLVYCIFRASTSGQKLRFKKTVNSSGQKSTKYTHTCNAVGNEFDGSRRTVNNEEIVKL